MSWRQFFSTIGGTPRRLAITALVVLALWFSGVIMALLVSIVNFLFMILIMVFVALLILGLLKGFLPSSGHGKSR